MPLREDLFLSENFPRAGGERHGLGMKNIDARADQSEVRPEVLRRAGGGAEVAGTVRPDEDGEERHRTESWVRMQAMSKERSENEQKAVEKILWALGHRLVRLRDEAAMKTLRGEAPEGVREGLEMALREVNDLLPRRKRLKG